MSSRREGREVDRITNRILFIQHEGGGGGGADSSKGDDFLRVRRAAENAGVVFNIPMAAMNCVAFRREVPEKVGPLDEAFGIGMFEDDDDALRVREAGLRVVCAEDSYVHHVGQGSFRELPREDYERLFRENRATFERKWGRPRKPHRVRDVTSAAVSRIE